MTRYGPPPAKPEGPGCLGCLGVLLLVVGFNLFIGWLGVSTSDPTAPSGWVNSNMLWGVLIAAAGVAVMAWSFKREDR